MERFLGLAQSADLAHFQINKVQLRAWLWASLRGQAFSVPHKTKFWALGTQGHTCLPKKLPSAHAAGQIDLSGFPLSLHPMNCPEKWSISLQISKQGCHSHQWQLPPRMVSLWVSGSSGRLLTPDRWGACQRNYFSEPRLLHLLIQRKTLNSLTWDIWFSFINNHLLMFRLPAFCCKTSIQLGSSPHPLRAVFPGFLEMPSPELKCLKIPT